MSTPNPKDLKKPGTQPPKPADGAKPKIPTAAGAKPPPKPPKPVATGGKPPDKKPVPKKEKSWTADTGTRKIGQIMVDLGFIDESQLWDILEEARTNGVRVGQVAVARGLLTEDQVLQAIAEQHHLRVVNFEDEKPTPQAIGMVQQAMAEVYKILPLKYENAQLTVVMADPGNLQALDDLRNFLGIQQVEAVLALPRQIEEAIKTAHAGQQDNIPDPIAELNADPALSRGREENSRAPESLT